MCNICCQCNSVLCSSCLSQSPPSPQHQMLVDEALIGMGGEELQDDIKAATTINGHNGTFRTEFELVVNLGEARNNTVNLIVHMNGGLKVLWSLKTRVRGDGELQVGIVVSALNVASIGADVDLELVVKEKEKEDVVVENNNNGDDSNDVVTSMLEDSKISTKSRSSPPSYKGVCMPWKPHDKKMHEGSGLLLLYPTCSEWMHDFVAEGRVRVVFSTVITAPGAKPSASFIKSLCMQTEKWRMERRNSDCDDSSSLDTPRSVLGRVIY